MAVLNFYKYSSKVELETDTQMVSPSVKPYVDLNDLREVVEMVVADWIEEDCIPSPIKFAQDLHKHLAVCGHCSVDDEILYDFDEHYKLKFNINDAAYYFETWRTWLGALNWKLEEQE